MNDENISYYAIIPANVRYDEGLPANAKLLYGEITALSNKKGYCYASNAYFAKLYKVSIRSIQSWIASLSAKGYISVELKYIKDTKKVDERRITIVSPHEENVITPVKKTSSPPCRNFPHPHEENSMENNTGINTTSNNTENNNTAIADFEKLWAIYPNKKGKSAALKAYEKAIKEGTTYADIERGILAYKAQIAREKTETRFIKHGSTFFNQRAWLDDYDTSNALPDYSGGENILDEFAGMLG